MKKVLTLLVCLVVLGVMVSCSTKKNTGLTRRVQAFKARYNTYFNGHWYFNGAKQDKHLAMFPEELPKRLIRMFSFPEETILDPFMGSGTTAAVARALGRNSVGYEINPDFIPLIKSRIGGDTLYERANVEIVKQKAKIDFEEEMKNMPYRFVDVHKIDKQVDVKKLRFGSRIDKDSDSSREEFFTVKEIISPELVLLSNGLTVRMIGIKQDPIVNGKATDFLVSKLKGKKVFLRYDETKYDEENHLMVYLYLENKTFINAHLLKNKLALVDDSVDFKYKTKFQKL